MRACLNWRAAKTGPWSRLEGKTERTSVNRVAISFIVLFPSTPLSSCIMLHYLSILTLVTLFCTV